MSISTRLKTLAAVLAVLAIAGVATPAAAKDRYLPVREPYAWQQIDRNGDGDISKKEWNWAEKHGYDRLDRHDNRRVTRKEYQAVLNGYLDYRNRQQAWYQHRNQAHGNQPGWVSRDGDHRVSDRHSDHDWQQGGNQNFDRLDRNQDGIISPWESARR